MSTIGDALAALRDVVLMQERLDVMRQEVDRLSADVKGLNDYVVSLDRRLVRIETLAELAQSRTPPPRIEG